MIGMLPTLILAALTLTCFFSATLQAASADSLYRQFRDPPATYSLMPYWYWNGRINPSDTRREIESMLAQGVHQAIAFPWDGMKQRYLSEEFWEEVGAALDIAAELHFTLNFADEFDWPSGHAWTPPYDGAELSKVLREHPEFRMQRLVYDEEHASGGTRWRAPAGIQFAVAARESAAGSLDAASLTLVENAEWVAPEGRWLITTYKLTPATGAHNTRIDLLNRDAVRAYIDAVYEEYARRFPQHLGKTMQLTIADHEGTYGVPIAYTPALFKAHPDLRRMLPLLVHDSTDARTAKAVRSEYLGLVSRLYVDSFSKQVADWCAAHALKHGTSLYEEQLYIQVGQAGNMFDHWRAGSIVEIDALLERARMPIDFKEAVSVAHFEHKPLLVENQGLQGHATYFSLEKARLGSNMALLWGANYLVPYFDYDPKKLTWPPQWFAGQPFWPYFHHYADYARRVQFMNAQGRHVAPVLIYYPLETAYANASTLFLNKPHRELFWNNAMDQTQNDYTALQLELARRGWDYHIADAHYLQAATIHDGALQLGDESFGTIILPPMTDIDPRSETKLRDFERAGGVVLRVPFHERKPFMDHLNYMEQIQVPPEIQEDLKPVLGKLGPPTCPFHADHIYCSHRTDGTTDWFWVVNDSDKSRTLPVDGPYEKWDAETGERSPIANELIFGPWDAYFVIPTNESPRTAPVRETLLTQFPDNGWRFTPESPYIDVPYAKDKNGDPLWLAPERSSLRNWWIGGPFPYDDHRGFFKPYAPETQPFDSKDWKWFESPDYIVTLPRERGIYYAFTYVDSPGDRDAEGIAAFADSLKVWVNGREVFNMHRHPKWSLLRDAWAERFPVHLHKGRNEVLLKIGPSLMVRTAFMFRIGTPVHERCDLSVSTPPGAISSAPHCFDEYHPVRFNTGTVPFTLQSWTDSALAHYSGMASYERSFELPLASAGRNLTLDLGAVGVAAEVWVNGKPCGQRVWRPFKFDIGKQSHPGANTLKIRIANSDAGQQAQGDTIYPRGSWGLHYKTELDRIPAIRPNGLEGPVRIFIAQ